MSWLPKYELNKDNNRPVKVGRKQLRGLNPTHIYTHTHTTKQYSKPQTRQLKNAGIRRKQSP